MSHICTLCQDNPVFPVRFVSDEHRQIGLDYHLRGACLHLAQQLLASEGENPRILDQIGTSVIKLEQISLRERQFNYFDIEECEHSARVQNEDVQALSLKLEHAFSQSGAHEAPKSLNKEVWVGLRDEYRREAGLTQECWLKQLYNCWTNMGTGGRTFFFAAGSLGIWMVQGLWEAAFYPQGRSEDDKKKAPCSDPVDLGKIRG